MSEPNAKAIQKRWEALEAERDSWKAKAEKLYDCLKDMQNQFSYRNDKNEMINGGLSSLEYCEDVLAEFEK